ncbi:phosphoadenosine phosphosulfate reductase domain-containing protein [Brevibacillus reuszeri]|uniref:phosphoadenosine phosphosulfate reductase domain-containing protein n=1 Tax=Brevibacillus reuszeri TaxID=54915 RepID=UPI000CCC5083|nr:phosphoadenosine phosphosulfate reductase family protein [Brevibacillus reuszeri]
MKNHIIFCSGGSASFAVADYVKSEYPEDNIVLYFTDTLWENEDLYRFIKEASDKLELPILTHSLGLNPIELMFEKKLVFNSRIGECSKVLKIKVASDFLKKGIKPPVEEWRNGQYLKQEDFTSDATLYFGIGIEELHREESIVKNWAPFQVEMPLIEKHIDIDAVFRKHDIKKPLLYDLGFSHNNCNGRCVKAGQSHFLNLKMKQPEVFQDLMEKEHYMMIYVSSYRYLMKIESDGRDGWNEEVRSMLLEELDDAFRDYFYGRAARPKVYIHPAASSTDMKITTYSFMKRKSKNSIQEVEIDEKGNEKVVIKYPSEPYMLRNFNRDMEKKGIQIDMFDIGGCGCFVTY